MYFFTRAVVDYQGHLMIKDGCLGLQERVLRELPYEEKKVYERLFELNYNYWHRMTECEKRMYSTLVDTEKDISIDVLLSIIHGQFDLSAQRASPNSAKVGLSKDIPAESNFYFATSNTGVQNNKIYSDNLVLNQNEQMNAFSGQFDTVQNLKEPTYPPAGNYDSDYRTPQINNFQENGASSAANQGNFNVFAQQQLDQE
jgi:hypothetical protein